jgi:hypothetical protein
VYHPLREEGVESGGTGLPLYKSIAELMYPRGLMLDFSIYQSGIDFKCLYSNRPLKPLTP